MLSCLACCGLVCKDNREKMGLMGPVMIRMAYMPLYIEKNLDVPPVHGRTDEKWKEM